MHALCKAADVSCLSFMEEASEAGDRYGAIDTIGRVNAALSIPV